MRNAIGCNQYKHAKFTEILKGYIEEELPHLPSSKEAIRIFILKLIEMRYIKRLERNRSQLMNLEKMNFLGMGSRRKYCNLAMFS